MDPRRAREIWARLVSGKPLDGLGLSSVDGRVDLQGLVAPAPSMLPRQMAGVKELSNIVVIRGACWTGLDFSNAQLDSIRFFNSSIEDCCFDGAHCQDWRMWGATISSTSFRGADLRRSALGGIENGRRNSFRRVDFTGADLRQTVYVSADMFECTFADTKLSNVDLQGTVFVDCVFAGELNEVIFHRQAFRGEGFPPNEMKGVDFRRARLHHVEFRGLDMADVQWPEDDEHVVVNDYKATLDRVLNLLNTRSDVASKTLAAVLSMKRKWAGRGQRQGVLNKRDLVEAAGEEAVAELVRQLSKSLG